MLCQLESRLVYRGMPPPTFSEALGAVQVEKRFKWIWADHGDDISMQYAGTGALKSGFTRTGRQQHSTYECHLMGNPCTWCCQSVSEVCGQACQLLLSYMC